MRLLRSENLIWPNYPPHSSVLYVGSTEMIIAIAVPAGVAGLVLLVVVVVCVVVVVRRRRKKNDLYEFQPMTFTNDSDGDDD